MLIEDPGTISIYMYSTPLVDIDFCCWGPFSDPFDPCGAGLTAASVVDCSYSTLAYETCVIPNGQTGEYYILLITNYSRQPCNITFSQTGGNGSTDCTILPPPVSNNGPLCVGETLNLYAETIPNATYWWSGPSGFLSTLQNPVIPNVTTANAGNYSCVITVNGQSSDPAITTVNIFNLPTASLQSGDTIVCVGTPAYAIFNLVGWGPFQVEYSDGTNTFVSPNLFGPKDTVFLITSEPTTYTFNKVIDSHCERTLLSMSLDVDTHPQASGYMTGSGDICAGEPVELEFDLAGTPPWTVTYTVNGTSPQMFVANSTPHILTVYPSVSTLYEFEVLEDANCNGQVNGQVQVTVSPTPTANAGTDQTLPYGANTILPGTASGGSGNYSYSWAPAAKLVNPNIAQPQTVSLTETTLFTLTVTDNNGLCQGTDEVWVTITGGPLGCNPTASPNEICHNLTSQLYATAGGGSGTYTYNWTSIPAGFTSTIPNPVVNPGETTTYQVAVSDGYNVVNGSVTVTVNPRPVPNAGADQTIPHGTSTTLTGTGAGGSGSYGYQWEPASKLVNPFVPDPQTVNLYTTTLFTLTVTDLATGCSSVTPAEMNVIISGDALSASPAAEPDEICEGQSTTLHALAGGGSGQYTYSWSSDPAGFSSNDPDPVISPAQSTLYTVQVNDGFNSTTGNVYITVLDAPEINLGPQSMTACVYDTISLNAGNPGSSYLWSNGSVDQIIKVATTGLGFDIQTHTVLVTSPSGCQAESSMTITFDFSACNSIDEGPSGPGVIIYPNPGNGNLHVSFENGSGAEEIAVYNLLGEKVFGPVRSAWSDTDGGKMVLQLEHLATGLYFVRIIMVDQSLHDFKYILRK